MADKFIVEWGELEVITPAILQRESLSVATGTGQEGTNFPATILFDRAQVELQGDKLPLYGSWVGDIRLPLTLPDDPPAVWFKTDLRFSAEMSAGTRALIVMAAEGETFVKELIPEEQARELAPREEEDLSPITHRDDTFEFVHRALQLPARQYRVSLFLTAARRGPEDSTRVSIDSLDISVNPNFQSLPQRG